MIKLSAIIIAKNEEDVIADCLESVRFCDEIIFVDDGSSDRTAEIASLFTDKVYKHVSAGYVEAARRFAIQKAKGKWVLLVDADERVTKALASSIKSVVEERNPEFEAVNVTRQDYYLGNNLWPTQTQIQRLFRKDAVKGIDWKLHTSPLEEAKVGQIDGLLLHFTHRNLTSMLEKTIAWSGVEADLKYQAHHPRVTWWRFPRVMLTAFYDYYIRQKGYKVGVAGLVESIYQAFSAFVVYGVLWEKQLEKTKTTFPRSQPERQQGF